MKSRASWRESAVLWYIPAFYGLCFFGGSFLQLHYFILNDVDFSYFLIQPWRIWNFGDWNVPFAQAIEGGAPFYAHHFTPLSALLAPVLGLFPSEYALSALHAASATATAFILPRLALAIRGVPDNGWLWCAGAMLLIFFVFRPYITAWSRQTHYTTLVAPFLALGCLFLIQGRSGSAFCCALMVCLGQERASVAVFGLGMFAWLVAGERKAGAILCLFSSAWFFTVVFLWLPWLRSHLMLEHSSYIMLGRLGPADDLAEKAYFMARICAWCCFLPFCGKKAALCACCALPNLGMALMSRRPGMYDLKGQYEDLPSVFLLISMIYGIFWLQKHLAPKQWRTAIACGVCLYLLLVLPANAGWYNPLVTSARLLLSPARADLENLNRDLALLAKLPGSATLYAQSGLGPRVSLRPNRLLLQKEILQGPLKNAVIALSPFCGIHELNCNYAEAARLADKHPDLALFANTGRLLIYASRDVLVKSGLQNQPPGENDDGQ